MISARAVIGGALLLVACYVAGLNWSVLYLNRRNFLQGNHRHHSTVPFVSLFFVMLAVLFYPKFGVWSLLIPALDLAHCGLLFFVVWAPIHWLLRRTKTAHQLGINEEH